MTVSTLGNLAPPANSRVLVVYNTASADGLTLANAYRAARNLPSSQMLGVTCTNDTALYLDEFDAQVAAPVKAAVDAAGSQYHYIVLMRGMPYLVRFRAPYLHLRPNANIGAWGTQVSLDAILGELWLNRPRTTWQDWYAFTPLVESFHFGGGLTSGPHLAAFNPANWGGMRLVGRIDGYSVEDCQKLIAGGVTSSPPQGLWALNSALLSPGTVQEGRADWSLRAYREEFLVPLRSRGIRAAHLYGRFWGGLRNLAAYYSKGSNHDPRPDPLGVAYYKRKVDSLSFLPGSFATMGVSTSARDLRNPAISGLGPANQTGQNLISDLPPLGCSGVIGSVSEPGGANLTAPQTGMLSEAPLLLVSRGHTFGEATWMTAGYARSTILLGDPLCAPYAFRG